MEPSDVVLYVASKVKLVPGRTSLQKLTYFANVKLRANVAFRPHYYGPYSSQIAEVTDNLLSDAFLDEVRESGSLSSPWVTPGGTVMTDWERRSYSITDAGKHYLQRLPLKRLRELRKLDPVLAKLQKDTNLDPKPISNLAKVHFLCQETPSIRSNIDSISLAAKGYGWKLTDSDVEGALKTLDSLHI
ncbi:MAG: hypothetical protein WB778_09135 [Thermoplasmata archaeon]